jgi:ribosome-associated protein
MVHLFTPENRDKYRMELLWRDAAELPLAKLLK